MPQGKLTQETVTTTTTSNKCSVSDFSISCAFIELHFLIKLDGYRKIKSLKFTDE